MTAIRAAAAARMPLVESSAATQALGVGLERAGDRQVDVGRGLAALDLLR
jgi:hypothetical protein